MLLIKMLLLPLLIFFTYAPYQFLKNQKTENEALFLRGFLLIYSASSLYLLVSMPFSVHILTNFSSGQPHLLHIIAGLWAVTAGIFFLHQLAALRGYGSSIRSRQSRLSRRAVAEYQFLYLMTSFLLAFYWFHPAIWFWYPSAKNDILPPAAAKEPSR